MHRTIAQVTAELERLHFNKAVALVRELSNAVEAFAPAGDADRAAAARGAGDRRAAAGARWCRTWPRSSGSGSATSALLVETPLAGRGPGLARRRHRWSSPVQVNGKRRAELELPRGSSREAVEALALADAAVQRAMEGRPPRRVVVVPDKIVNVVV